MPERLNISSGSSWEEKVGYSRLVKVGPTIEVSGTVAVEEGELIGKNDPYLQTQCILKKISRNLEKVGASLKEVIRTRIYVRNIEHWPEVARAHQEFFADIKPASTLLQVSAFIQEDFLVEIEASAYLSKNTPS